MTTPEKYGRGYAMLKLSRKRQLEELAVHDGNKFIHSNIDIFNLSFSFTTFTFFFCQKFR